MSKFFDWIADYIPGFIYLPLWLLMMIPRLAVLMLLPPGSYKRWHTLNPLFRFLGFEKG